MTEQRLATVVATLVCRDEERDALRRQIEGLAADCYVAVIDWDERVPTHDDLEALKELSKP